MLDPQSPISPHLYPQAIQLKLYQAFIFSIPILFSIILFLLFYLFYLKRRASSLSSPPMVLPVSSTDLPSPHLPSVCLLDVKVELKEKLHIVLFSEELGTIDSLCCVCLGEFELKEELVEMPSCKHIFHLDCIHLWLYSHTTCPLCRSSVLISSTKTSVDDDNDHLDSPQTTSPV
ncbi:E3 ubiquitin-protein ligase RHA4A [Hirschfeldia incana]|nr:E3 ubiquitin-protein ligase RHA4A [Hirschfeldia incana]